MRLAIGMPWYDGPSVDTAPVYMDLMMYFGALRERSIWVANGGSLEGMPPLDEVTEGVKAETELTAEDWARMGRLEIVLINRTRLSMVGKARELLVEDAQEVGADYLFCWDADMLFNSDSFIKLWRNQVPVVAALAFTARHPIHPVIYRMRTHWDETNNTEQIDGSDVIFDYPRDKLISNEDIEGELAFGTGVFLCDMRVFREMPKPWFNSTGCGEDWFFCHRCSKFGIPRYVDTRVKSVHREHQARWASEESYWNEREAARKTYTDIYGSGVRPVVNGRLA